MTDPDRTLTRPWVLDELAVVSGFRCVYRADKKHGVTLIHLPGRRSASVAELKAEGHDVRLPKRIRYGQ